MRIIDLAQKDLLQMLRDWKAAAFLVIMPVLFTLLFGAIFSGGNTRPEETRIAVGVWDEDHSDLSRRLFELLQRSELIQPFRPHDNQSPADLQVQVEAGELAALVTIPVGYENDLKSGARPEMIIIINQASSASHTVRYQVQAYADQMLAAAETATFSTQVYAQMVGFSSPEAELVFLNQGIEIALESWERPAFRIQSTERVSEAQAKTEAVYSNNSFAHSSAGMMVQFALAGLISAGEVLVLERQSRALQRLLTTPIARYQILAGHYLAILAIVLLQLTILTVFGQVFLDVPYFSKPGATALIVVCTALFAASTGLLIGTLAKTPEHVIIFSLVPMFVLSGLGGAWMPLEFTNRTFQTIGHFTPLAWAMDGFKNVTVRGLGIEAALLPAAVLLAFAIVLFFLATWRFRFE
ncbi:MAG: ABC transporter permease [Anaerolineales bacterium]|nr:ABC transporter permease [Anaerolineales bacterium]